MSTTIIEFLKAWFIFSFSLGCWTCLNLTVNRSGDRRVKYTILIFIILLSMAPLNAYITLTNGKAIHGLLILTQQVTWTLGPLMVLLIKHILLQNTRPYLLVLHAVPFSLGMAYGVLEIGWIHFPIFFAALFTQVFSYLAYAIYLLQKHRIRFLNLTTNHKNTTYYWLMYLVASLMLIMMIDFYIYTNIYLGNFHSYLFTAVIASAIAIYVNTIALFSVYQPTVFFHETKKDKITQSGSEEIIKPKPGLRSIELSPEAAQQLDEQLQQLIETHKPHLDDSISLPKLAALLGVTSHQLSELLNIHKSISFYDFLNDLRYEESIHFLTKSNTELTIADIAYQSGFNNRNSFYKVFKDKTGLTPSQYKKSISSN
ncbi:MAG: AraC family transcriptional regulator [Pseudomonadota bacterium]